MRRAASRAHRPACGYRCKSSGTNPNPPKSNREGKAGGQQLANQTQGNQPAQTARQRGDGIALSPARTRRAVPLRRRESRSRKGAALLGAVSPALSVISTKESQRKRKNERHVLRVQRSGSGSSRIFRNVTVWRVHWISLN